jgi:hypothetical protein
VVVAAGSGSGIGSTFGGGNFDFNSVGGGMSNGVGFSSLGNLAGLEMLPKIPIPLSTSYYAIQSTTLVSLFPKGIQTVAFTEATTSYRFEMQCTFKHKLLSYLLFCRPRV